MKAEWWLQIAKYWILAKKKNWSELEMVIFFFKGKVTGGEENLLTYVCKIGGPSPLWYVGEGGGVNSKIITYTSNVKSTNNFPPHF